MPADQPHRLAEHAHQRHQQTLRRAQQALTELADTGQHVTAAQLARHAGVSRSWIYTQPELRHQLQRLGQHHTAADRARQTGTRASDDSLRRRLTVAHERITALQAENKQLRDALAHVHGQLRAARQNSATPSSQTPVHNTKPLIKDQI
ncbi:MAG: DUF6262 family protein [Pseudonocardia sp.]